jgi:tRNA (cmo5U34)-methyltransferase
MKLELMNQFFDSRLEEYENHMLECIESAREFYKYTASILPMNKDAAILDLGCGTGLELDEYFKLNPSAHVTGIDLAQGMLSVLKAKHSNKNITLICGSYFDEDFGTDRFDAAVSVESLHHFTASEKRPLYTNLFNSLKPDSYFVLTDYFASGDYEEKLYRSEYIRLKKEQGLSDDMFYHYDTPLTVDHEIQVLLESGFNRVEILQSWSNTYTLKAIKS